MFPLFILTNLAHMLCFQVSINFIRCALILKKAIGCSRIMVSRFSKFFIFLINFLSVFADLNLGLFYFMLDKKFNLNA